MLYDVFAKTETGHESGSLLRGDLPTLRSRGVIIQEDAEQSLRDGCTAFAEVANTTGSGPKQQVVIAPYEDTTRFDQFIAKWGLSLREVVYKNEQWRIMLGCKNQTFQATTTVWVTLPTRPDLRQTLKYLADICRLLKKDSQQASDRQQHVKNQQHLLNMFGFEGYIDLLNSTEAAVS